MFTSNKSSVKRILFSLLMLIIFGVFTACSSRLTDGSDSQSIEAETAGEIKKTTEEIKDTAETAGEIQESEENLETEEKVEAQVKDSEGYDAQEEGSLDTEDTQSNSSGGANETDGMSSAWDGVYTDGNTTVIIIYGGSRVCIVQDDASYFVDNMEEDITENSIFSIMDDPEFEYHAEHTFSLNGDSIEYKEAIRVGEDYWGSDEDLTVVIDGVFERNDKDEHELFDYYRNQ